MQIATNSFIAIQQDYFNSIAWMKSIGVKIDKGRLINYEKILNHWIAKQNTASNQDAEDIFPDFTNSLSEINEFIAIHKAFKNECTATLQEIAQKLEISVNGPISQSDENENSSRARNILFEVSVAARIHTPNKEISSMLTSGSDTGVFIKNKKIWIECKRIASRDKLLKNLKKAANQLSYRLNDNLGSNHRGVIALDVTKLLVPPKTVLETRDDLEMVKYSESLLENFINSIFQDLEKIYTKKHKKIIGVIFKISFMGVSKSRNLLVHSNQWAVNPNPLATQTDTRALEYLVESIRQN